MSLDPTLLVVKVGGSLLGHPRLGPGLRLWLGTQPEPRVVLLAGGGPLADVVREWDSVHRPPGAAVHWLANATLRLSALLLTALLPETLPLGRAQLAPPKVPAWRRWLGKRPPPPVGPGPARYILDGDAFARLDAEGPAPLPVGWDVTSDSLALRAARVLGAGRLVLLKSTPVPEATDWADAAVRGWVDRHFPAELFGAECGVRAMDFRDYLDRLAEF